VGQGEKEVDGGKGFERKNPEKTRNDLPREGVIGLLTEENFWK